MYFATHVSWNTIRLKSRLLLEIPDETDVPSLLTKDIEDGFVSQLKTLCFQSILTGTFSKFTK